MSTSLAQAFERAAELQRKARVRPVVLPPPEQLRTGVAKRPAAQVPLTLRPVSVMRPPPETDAEIKAFVTEEFREAQRKRESRR